MDRRTFLSLAAAQGLRATGLSTSFARGGDGTDKPFAPAGQGLGAIDRLAGLPLPELLEFHRRRIFDEFLPPWTEHGVDWEYGGFFTRPYPDGPPAEHDKEMYYQGRALWMFSYAHNHLSHDPRHLEAARKGREFLLKYALRDDATFYDTVDRRGKVVGEAANIYGDMYMILGLAEFYRAEPHEEDLDLCVQCAHRIMSRLTSSDYMFEFHNHGGPVEPGQKSLGAWQHFLGGLTQLLRVRPDPSVDKIARLCVRNIMDRHWQPEYNVFLELLDGQFRPYPSEVGSQNRIVVTWHSLQACWMVEDEALRRGSGPIFRDAAAKGITILEDSYVEGVGPVNFSEPGAGKESFEGAPGSRWGCIDDTLLFCLLTLEHTHAPWAMLYYDKLFNLYNSKPEHWRRTDLLHYPRRLFYSVEILQRIIERGGRTSEFLS